MTLVVRNASTFFFAFLLSVLASGKTYRLSPADNWFGLLHGNGLRPGDEVILEAGTYSNERRLELVTLVRNKSPLSSGRPIGPVSYSADRTPPKRSISPARST